MSYKLLPVLAFMVCFAGMTYAAEEAAKEEKKIADISHDDLVKAIKEKKVILIDCNGTESYDAGHIPGAIDFAKAKEELAKNLLATIPAEIRACRRNTHRTSATRNRSRWPQLDHTVPGRSATWTDKPPHRECQLFGSARGDVTEVKRVDGHNPQKIQPSYRGREHLQKGHGGLESAGMTGQGKEQSAGAAEQAGTDHPDGHDIELPAAEEFVRDSAGEKALTTGSDSGAAQAVALLARWDGLKESGENIAALLMEGAFAFDIVPFALCGNGCKALPPRSAMPLAAELFTVIV